jgi:ribonuclease HII
MLKQYYKQGIAEAGCDEAGRGCLAGPVVAAAVILPEDFGNEMLNDSKKLSEKKRLLLRQTIIENAVSYAIGIVSPEEIDKINILNASILAMHKALDGLNTIPAHILVDGNRFKPYRDIPHTTVVKGDGKFMSIAAASILAKTTRDEIMQKLHKEFPDYQWDKNKGYPTKTHIAGIDKVGYCKYHRRSFHLKRQLKLDFG